MPPTAVFVVPSFHYDVAYLKPYAAYLPDCFAILDEALRLLEAHDDYRFLVEQVILLMEYWERFPDKRPALKKHAASGRLAVGPGMFVMPDMNHPDGESLFLQARLGKAWLKEHLGVEAKVCWIADCWGHPPQLPQILRQCGYDYYVFWRCMRRDLLRNDFRWIGLDGTELRTHWLARGYGNLRFPSEHEIVNAAEMDWHNAGAAEVRKLRDTLAEYGPTERLLVVNGGDMAFPQATGPAVLRRINAEAADLTLRFATPEEFLHGIDWASAPAVTGEFNAAFQGTFTSNIRLKQRNRALVNKLLSLEALVVARGTPADYTPIWRQVLKQQFHDILCGTITDAALAEAYAEFDQAEQAIDAALGTGDGRTWFNPLAWPRTEMVEAGDKRLRVELPALGMAAATALAEEAPGALPTVFETPWYRAQVDGRGYITSLQTKPGNVELVRGSPCAFGALAMQFDHGDLWLNFVSPLNGGSLESTLVQEDPDPFSRVGPGSITMGTIVPGSVTARVLRRCAGIVEIEQRGELAYWRLRVPFVTRLRLSAHNPRIEYRTTILPAGRHYRIRAAFPTTLIDGTRRDEVSCGVVTGRTGEQVAQNFVALAGAQAGLALLNRGTPGVNVHEATLLLTLFRAAAMEYKTDSTGSYNEGVEHTFDYALVPHEAGALAAVVREGMAFNRPPVSMAAEAMPLGNWRVRPENVVVAGLRWSGGQVFVRLYETAGLATEATLEVPGAVRGVCEADGLERPVGAVREQRGTLRISLKPYEIRGVLVRVGR